MEAVEGSLRRLDRDYIDLYQFHHPDPETPIEDTLGALADLMAEGKVRSIGCSNVSAADLGAALHATTAFGLPKFLCVQNELSLLKPGARADILPACREADVAFLPYFPLASGLLSGKYVPGRPPPADSRLASWGEAGLRVLNGEVMDSIARLKAWAEERGHTILELAFAWLLAERQVGSVIAGATTPEQVRANVAAAGWALDRQDLVAIDDLLPQFQRDAASGTIA
jgi:aryl-alcohol dehydrogenase-like predicted oxidoreductase